MKRWQVFGCRYGRRKTNVRMNHQLNNQLNQWKKFGTPDILVKRHSMNYHGELGKVMMIVGRKRVGSGDRWKHMTAR